MFEEKNFMADVAKPEKPKVAEERADFDENGLSKELWPYRDEMKRWADEHIDDFGSFLEYRNAKFKLVCGTGFYHAPGKDIISLSVPFYKGCKESGEMTIDQIFFASLHEFAHLKTMLELDRAGKKNQMQQFVYEKNKVIRDKKDSAKFATLGSTYRQFYNIMEDAIVNRLVLSTRHYSESNSDASRGRNQEIKDLYTDKFFPMFKEVGEGQGEYLKNPGKREAKDKPYLKVGKGNGNLESVSAEDYQRGFNWNEMKPEMGRSGQFLTFFMKNQMTGLKKEEIYDEVNNPMGTHELHPDVALALTRPLPEVYATLLKKINEKYKDDPAQVNRYADFMTQASRIEVFAEKNGKISQEEPDIVVNVCNPNAIKQGTFEVNHALAKSQYVEKLKSASQKIGSYDPRSLSFLDVFDKYKDVTRSKEYSWTFPLKHNLLERTRMTREVLEPIFTMLCILDDSFDVELPPETRPNNPEPSKEKQENHEKPDWKRGDKVVNEDKNSSYFGKKGVLTGVTFGVDGNVESVTVEYFEDGKSKMAGSVSEKIVLTGEIEEVYKPDENLALWIEKQKSEGKQKSEFDDKRKKKYEEEEKEEEEEKGEDDEDEDESDDKEKQEGDEQQPEQDKSGDEDGEGEEADLDEALESLEEKYLKELMEQDEREANLKEAEDQKKTAEYQEKKGDLHRAQQLLEQLRRQRQEKGDPHPSDPNFSDKEIVKKYLELEKRVALHADKMAQNWLEVVNNIASRIDAVKDKYYRSGKIDYRKLQRHFPEIEMGIEIDQRLIYERIVEKVVTEVKPQMLRILLLIDNSGSMAGEKLKNMQMAIMLLNSSLRSFRLLFKDKMQEIFGNDYRPDFDLVCDTEIRLFGSQSQLVKSFDVKDLSFLENEEAERPAIDVSKEIGGILHAFQKMTVNEGTNDNEAWGEIFISHNDEKFKQLIKDNRLTEAIFQISDGVIMDSEDIAVSLIKSLRNDIGVGVGGFAIGDNENDREAFNSLSERHGRENVINANTPEQIVEEFGKLLRKIIVEKIEQPMEQYLENMGHEIED